jgi:Histidine kinase-, DNA gyrase B-, and HSP90-like ATPase
MGIAARERREMPTDRAEARVAKRYFIALITRDITLEDAILDLIDNSVNSALRQIGFDSTRVGALLAGTVETSAPTMSVDVTLTDKRFEILDTCGGIDVEVARHDMFRFGRDDTELSGDILSVYGIGLKRAIFKLGAHIVIKSHRKDQAFEVEIPVQQWAEDRDNWSFGLREIAAKEAGIQNGTSIVVTDLYPEIIEKSKLSLINGDLQAKVASTYSLFADKIAKFSINKKPIRGTPVTVTEAAEIDDFEVSGCRVRIIATLMPGQQDGSGWRSEEAGWYILCNGRTVVAADKTQRTGWGAQLPNFVSKFRAFRGIVNFLAEDPEVLPWTTTKTDINQESVIYQKTLPRMVSTARPVLDYLNSLYPSNEVDATAARAAASSLMALPLTNLMSRPVTSFSAPVATGPQMVRVQFDAKMDEIRAIRQHIKRQSSASRIGRMCFDYYLRNEVEG